MDRAGTSDPRHPPLRRLARSPDQCASPIVRRGLACAIERAHTEPGAAAGRELLGNYAARFGRIKTRAHTKSPGSFRGTQSALPSKMTSVLLATAWPLEKPEAAERNERPARTRSELKRTKHRREVVKAAVYAPPATPSGGCDAIAPGPKPNQNPNPNRDPSPSCHHGTRTRHRGTRHHETRHHGTLRRDLEHNRDWASRRKWQEITARTIESLRAIRRPFPMRGSFVKL